MNTEIEDTNITTTKSKEENSDRKFRIIKHHFRNQFRQSYKYIGFYLLFSFAKYLACFYTLQQRDEKCDVNPLFIWLTIVGMYEFLNSIRQVIHLFRYLTILYSLQMNSKDIFLLVIMELVCKDNQCLSEFQEINKRAQIKRMIKIKLQESPLEDEESPFTQWEVIQQAERLNKYTRVMKVYNQFVFYLIFTAGNLAYISSDGNDCDNHLNQITFILLIVGYLFSAFLIVGFGLAILSMGLYLPVILFLFFFKTLGNVIKRIQTNNKFKKMLKHTYTAGLDMTQCNICMYEYQHGESITELPCSKRHHFHQDCLKQWIVIKQQCPVCRKDI